MPFCSDCTIVARLWVRARASLILTLQPTLTAASFVVKRKARALLFREGLGVATTRFELVTKGL
jgi:hypothetical protein